VRAGGKPDADQEPGRIRPARFLGSIPQRSGNVFVDGQGKEPYFTVPSSGIKDFNDPIRKWPFNDPDYNLLPVLNLAVGGSGGGDPASGRDAGRLRCRSSDLSLPDLAGQRRDWRTR
jgi:hypothetical protein